MNLLSDAVQPMCTLFLMFSASSQTRRGSKNSAMALPLMTRSPLKASSASGQGLEAPRESILLSKERSFLSTKSKESTNDLVTYWKASPAAALP